MDSSTRGKKNTGVRFMILGVETFNMFEKYLGYTKTAKPALLYSQILSLSKIKGGCVANNKYFAELLNISERAVSGYINKMQEANLIKRFDEKIGHDMTSKRHLYPIETPYSNVNAEIIGIFGNIFRKPSNIDENNDVRVDEDTFHEDSFSDGRQLPNTQKLPSEQVEGTFQNTGRQLPPYNKVYNNIIKYNKDDGADAPNNAPCVASCSAAEAASQNNFNTEEIILNSPEFDEKCMKEIIQRDFQIRIDDMDPDEEYKDIREEMIKFFTHPTGYYKCEPGAAEMFISALFNTIN